MGNLLDVFEQTAARFPDKTAVAFRDESYTFSGLRDVSRRLGACITTLRSEGEPVGVLVNRGAVTAVFFLAVLYSGNFYVPIDSEMPHEKISIIMEDADIRLMLCDEDQRDALEDLGFDGDILTIGNAFGGSDEFEGDAVEDSADIRRKASSDPMTSSAASASSDTPAYMIYTSGSTGRPKGVLKSHGSVIDFMETYIKLFDLSPEEIIGNQTPFFFDASAKDFYLMLFTGATLEILPSELFVFPVTLIEYMNERHISYICWVPSALSVVTQLNTFQQVVPTDLKKIFFVGETFPVKQLRKWMEALPDLKYVNLYGSTEIAGVCCYYELPVPFEGEEIPIGRPLPNCWVFLMDKEGNLITAPDTVSDICVVSSSLALEYYHDPERTANTFITLRLPDGSRMRALRTGDLGKYDASGELYFASRSDDQIKHMGHRIELGEIEAAAHKIPEVARCCCLFNEQKNRICLFCELVPGCDWDGKRIRHELQDKLSDYMIPAKYYILDEIPLNANGKADRIRLRDMF